MDSNFQVTTRLLTEKATVVNNINEDFKETMKQIRDLINGLDREWKSDAAREFVEKFNSLYTEFNNYYRVVDSYKQFLIKAAEDYVAAETKIQQGIS
ncbi:hypothetical protein SH1V18_10970 [Vallitalea longa]|uniref:ESAT-6-like protein n=1 Tax=Vallitalea longa TaxID=2936439 RepID=A0A9W5Y895_9FIRM|nr:WXG100 family type VII secretion target [Vallitalea longa]GKX28617.1 hypothetical protein SH1V18_10970 [Vallitalea longa]